MFTVHGTKKFLDRVGEAAATDDEPPTTALGNWYATVMFWKPQVALFVNEATLFPVLLPMAPAVTVVDRLPRAAGSIFLALGLGTTFVESEIAEMAEHTLTTTRSRSILGVMNEFVYLGKVYRRADGHEDLVALSLRLAEVPCGPLGGRHGSPDRELTAYVSHLSA